MESLLKKMNDKNAALIEELKRLRTEEQDVRSQCESCTYCWRSSSIVVQNRHALASDGESEEDCQDGD